MIENIEFILGFFILFYFLLLFYDMGSLYYRRRKIDEKHQKKLQKLFENNTSLKGIEIKKIYHLLKRLSYLYALNKMLEENIEIKNIPIRELILKPEYHNLFLTLKQDYEQKDDLSKSYYAYILQYTNLTQKEIYDFLYQCLHSKSIYCIENALITLYNFGNPSAIVEAYLIMSQENINYNYKLVSDGLLKFKGQKKLLCEQLYQNFANFLASFKIGFLTFFRQCKYDIKEELLKRLITNQEEKEVIIEMIRYFSKVLYPPVAILFQQRLINNYYKDFEYEVVMIQALASYPSSETIEVLKKFLASQNYYVRYNAAKSLATMTNLKEITNIEDKYAQEMIQSLIKEEGVL